MNKNQLIQVMSCLQQISEQKGSGSVQRKIDLLRSFPEKDDLQFVLRVAMDGFWQTHVATIDILPVDQTDTDINFREFVGNLISVKALTKEMRNDVVRYVNAFPSEFRGLLVKILTKSLNIGIGVKSINDAFQFQLIPDVEIMKAEDDVKVIKQWFMANADVYAEMKYDGIRGFAEMKDGKVAKVRTYNMTELDTAKLTYLVPQLEALAEVWSNRFSNNHYFFDFEITNELRQTVSGEVNRLIKGTAVEGCDEKWVFNIFDVHTWDIFDGGSINVSYDKRRMILEYLFSESKDLVPNLVLAERWKVSSYMELQDLFTKVLEQGCEGLVVKIGSGNYELKRSNLWIKMKAINETDLIVTGWYQGLVGTKRADFGGLTCQTSDGQIVVNVGSGYSDAVLKDMRENGFDYYIGKIVTVKYNTVISKSDSDVKSLFLPRFKTVRFDKQVADSIDKVKK